LRAAKSGGDESLNRILVIRGGAIGDFVLTLPALRLLREGFPAAHIEILGSKHIAVLAEIGGYANAIRSIEYAPLSRFFISNGELTPELIEYFSSFQQIVSYLFDPDQIFAANLKRCGVRNLLTGSPKITGEEHAARQLARPIEHLALCLDDPAAMITLNENAPVDRPAIAIHAGSGSETKNWPLDRFVEVARALLLPNEKQKLILVGGEADRKRIADLRAALPNERIEIAQDLSLPELARVLRGCGFFLGHDSGISHLAAAVGTRSLLLFGPTDPAIWAPANPQVRVLRSADGTMRGIGIAQVLAALRELRS
jgi:heptosyltransferase-2